MRVTSLSSVCEIIMGQAPRGETYNGDGIGLPLIAGASDLGEVTPKPSRFTSDPTKISRAGDIILCVRATIGDLNWSDREYCLGRGVAALRANAGRADPRYLWHVVEYHSDKLSALGRGATFKQVSRADIAGLEIPIPSLPEQRRIAAILDQADALRRLRQRAIDRLNELGQAIFYEMFGDPAINRHRWDLIRLADISTKFSDGPFGSNLKSEHYVEEGIRVIRLQNIGVDAFNDDDKAFISKGHFESLKKHSCVPGDILIGTLGDPNLRACIQPPHIPIALNKADCVQMRCAPKRALAEYVCALLNCPSTERMAQDKIQGQTRLRISMGRLRELRVPVPPIERQFQFAKIMHEIRVSTTGQLAAQKIIDSLFSSLQHRAFTGALTSKDVERELAIAG